MGIFLTLATNYIHQNRREEQVDQKFREFEDSLNQEELLGVRDVEVLATSRRHANWQRQVVNKTIMEAIAAQQIVTCPIFMYCIQYYFIFMFNQSFVCFYYQEA
jgi:hypothetical protein